MPNEKRESRENFPKNNPVIESFLDTSIASEVWPAEISNNEAFIEQLNARKELRERLENVTNQLPRPDISLQVAINQRLVTPEQVEKLYNSLADLLESGENYERLALYLPFEFLPNANWKSTNEELEQAKNRFSEAYLKAFKTQLSMHDVRANFVDGDVLEADQESGNQTRVVKAGHLMPMLVEKGLMTVEDVKTIMKETDDEVLKNSVAEALLVIEGAKKTENEKGLQGPAETNLLNVEQTLEKEFSKIDSQKFGDITEKRKKWLKEQQKQVAIEQLGENLSSQLNEIDVAEFLSPEAMPASQQVVIEGIRRAIESTALDDPKKAEELYIQYKEVLLELWTKNQNTEALTKTFRRLYQLSIINAEELEQLNITVPKLEGPFSENLASMKEEMAKIQEMIRSAESNPELMNLIYPAVIVFGSKLKGYGGKNADLDLAVFVKPGTSIDEQKKIQELLQQTFSLGSGEIINEFWLDEHNGSTSIRNPEEFNAHMGKSYWTYILFNGAWEGNPEIIQKLQQELLLSYMYDTNEKIEGQDARTLYLTEMERDLLQYRLMHKGYEKCYPAYGGVKSHHANTIDGKSMFYDSGYRQLATKLFVNQVFLPKLSK